MNARLTLIALIIAGLGQWTGPAKAATSDWFIMPGGKMRLVATTNLDSLNIDAALEIHLEKGWKTYWRSPGDSGIPPQFSFIGSTNVENTTVEFPTPSFFTELETRIIGYKKKVIFPISVRIARQFQPTLLKLSAIIGVCAEICVPVQAKLLLNESGLIGPSADVLRTINDAKSSLPSGPSEDFGVESAKWDASKPGEIRISSRVPDGSKSIQLHVEGPTDWYLLPAKMDKNAESDGKVIFNLDILDIPKDANPSSTELRFTLVADGRGVEQLLTPDQ